MGAGFTFPQSHPCSRLLTPSLCLVLQFPDPVFVGHICSSRTGEHLRASWGRQEAVRRLEGGTG